MASVTPSATDYSLVQMEEGKITQEQQLSIAAPPPGCWERINAAISRIGGIPKGQQELIVEENAEEIDFAAIKAARQERYEGDIAIRRQTAFVTVPRGEVGLEGKGNVNIIIAIVDGEPKYVIPTNGNLRKTPASPLTKTAIGLGLLGCTGVSYHFVEQGILTRELMSPLTLFAVAGIKEIPFVPTLVTPAALAAGAFAVKQITGSHVVLSFIQMAAAGIFAGYCRRAGKKLAIGGWSGVKEFVIPKGCTETGLVDLMQRTWSRVTCRPVVESAHATEQIERRDVGEFSLKPLDENGVILPEDKQPKIVISVFDKDFHWQLYLGDKAIGEPVNMAAGKEVDDDDDDEDEKEVKEKKPEEATIEESEKPENVEKKENPEKAEKAKKKKKKDKKAKTAENPEISVESETVENAEKPAKVKVQKKDKNNKPSAQKKYGLYSVMGVAAIGAEMLTPQSLISGATNDMIKASVKLESRDQAMLNAYGALLLTTAVLITIKMCSDSFVGNYYYMPLTILTSLMGKAVFKDIVGIAGKVKDARSPDLTSLHPAGQKLRHKVTGWTPEPIASQEDPSLDRLSDPKYKKGKMKLNLSARNIASSNPDIELDTELVIKGDSFKATVKVPKEHKDTTFVANGKAKLLSEKYERIYLATCVAFTFITNAMGALVVANVLNKAFSTYMKTAAIKFPLGQTYGGFGGLTAAGVTVDAVALSTLGVNPGMSVIPSTTLLAIVLKHAKKWANGGPFSKPTGYLLTDWPSNEDFTRYKESLKSTAIAVFTCPKTTLHECLSRYKDEDVLVMEDIGDNIVEVTVHAGQPQETEL